MVFAASGAAGPACTQVALILACWVDRIFRPTPFQNHPQLSAYAIPCCLVEFRCRFAHFTSPTTAIFRPTPVQNHPQWSAYAIPCCLVKFKCRLGHFTSPTTAIFSPHSVPEPPPLVCICNLMLSGSIRMRVWARRAFRNERL